MGSTRFLWLSHHWSLKNYVFVMSWFSSSQNYARNFVWIFVWRTQIQTRDFWVGSPNPTNCAIRPPLPPSQENSIKPNLAMTSLSAESWSGSKWMNIFIRVSQMCLSKANLKILRWFENSQWGHCLINQLCTRLYFLSSTLPGKLG